LKSSLSLQTSDEKHEFHKSPYALREIKIQAIDRFGKRLGFVKLVATITNSEGDSLPGSVFLRGPSVGMMVLLQPDDLPAGSYDEKHVLLTVQPRVPAGHLQFVELPAGMVDDGGSFQGTAAKELQEECGLNISVNELINLSAGGCDEYVPIFLYEKRIPREQLKEWTGRLTGLRDEGERVCVEPFFCLCSLTFKWASMIH
jgi:ADP-sugar diphosphatase